MPMSVIERLDYKNELAKLRCSIARLENRLETAITRINLILTRLQVPECYKIPEEE